MTYVIGPGCIDVLDRSCVDVCPVDCIHVGERKSYINASACIDCGACEVECPVSAIVADRRARGDETLNAHLEDSRAFFLEVLPGRDRPLDDPGGAPPTGEIGVDTPLVAAHPKRNGGLP
ncbi:indolepyruvate ferredoxin oxidoreductase subunit alpha [Streptosporangium sp. NPDC001559]|uniref:indolepyruvate ferredoxin oxidoreductase subunit alpha n=1 Tax=Streptosporangium sp. NPDC001559 TaxID=3366187 RepID=UPI0036E8AD41